MNVLYIKHELHYLMNKILGVNNSTRNQLEEWLSKIDIKDGRVLDVGVGFSPVKRRLRNFKPDDYKTLDNNSENEIKPDFVLDLNDLESKTTMKKIMDYRPTTIFCLEVMEYVYKPFDTLRFFNKSLSKNGVLYISFHTFYPWHKPYKNDYMRYTKAGVIKLLEEAGFAKWEIKARTTTSGGKNLLNFFKKEGLIGFRDKINLDMGYLVKAYK